jgi:hypothetical protein
MRQTSTITTAGPTPPARMSTVLETVPTVWGKEIMGSPKEKGRLLGEMMENAVATAAAALL